MWNLSKTTLFLPIAWVFLAASGGSVWCAPAATDSTSGSGIDASSDIESLYRILGHELTPIKASEVHSSESNARSGNQGSNPSPAKRRSRESSGASDFGTIKVTVDPDKAIVLVDARSVPLDSLRRGAKVKPGVHTIAASVDGYQGFLTTVDIQPLETQTVMIALKRSDKQSGALHVYSYPWAALFVDSVYQGTTPLPKPLSLTEGPHVLMLHRTGFVLYVDTVFVKKVDTVRVKIHLQKVASVR